MAGAVVETSALGAKVLDPVCHSDQYVDSGVHPGDVSLWLCEYRIRNNYHDSGVTHRRGNISPIRQLGVCMLQQLTQIHEQKKTLPYPVNDWKSAARRCERPLSARHN